MNIDMVRAGCPEVRDTFAKLVIELWTHPVLENWDEEVVVSKLIMLWKGKGSRADLDKYRSISLLSIVSRVVAKVVATRLLKFAEKKKPTIKLPVGIPGLPLDTGRNTSDKTDDGDDGNAGAETSGSHQPLQKRWRRRMDERAR